MHLTDAQINDLVDETVEAGELPALLEHVRFCAQCRAEVEALRAMLAQVGTLPLSIQPARDLRPQMWAQADRKTLWNWRYPLAAAAVLLIALTSIVTLTISRKEDVRVTNTTFEAPSSVDVVSLDAEYQREVSELQRALRENRDNLAPETIEILEANLRVIDSAISEAREALARDPASSTLGEVLKSAYHRKLELLKQAARTTAAT